MEKTRLSLIRNILIQIGIEFSTKLGAYEEIFLMVFSKPTAIIDGSILKGINLEIATLHSE